MISCPDAAIARAARPAGVAVALLFTVLAIPVASAHHAYRVVYDFSQTRTIEGRVVRLELVNPHARLFLSVPNEEDRRLRIQRATE